MSRSLFGQLGWTAWALAGNWKMLRPTYEIPDFSHLVVPPATKLVVLDKDNCFAKPHTLGVWPPFREVFDSLRKNPDVSVVVLSNTAGDAEADPTDELARGLEAEIGLPVLRHKLKKPMCYSEILANQPSGGVQASTASEVLVVGDRLLTDVLMANVMGAKSVWINQGHHPNIYNRVESFFARK